MTLLLLVVVTALVFGIIHYAGKLAHDLLDLTKLGQSTLVDIAEQARIALVAEKALNAALRDEMERVRTDLADARQHNQHLFGQIVELRRDGFSMPENTPLAPPVEQKDTLPQVIREAIMARSRNLSDTAQMERFAHGLLVEEIEPDVIAKQILRGADLSQIA